MVSNDILYWSIYYSKTNLQINIKQKQVVATWTVEDTNWNSHWQCKILFWRSTLNEDRLIYLWRFHGWHLCFNSFLNTLVTILMPRKQKWKHWRQWELQIGIFIYNVHIWTQWSIFNSVGLHNCHGSMDVIFWNSIPKHTIYSYIGKVA